MLESQSDVFVRSLIGYDIFISGAFAPFARPMVSQVRVDAVNVKLPTSYGCY